MKTQESMENYLETIYVLNQKTGFVRSVDVALEMGFSKPSISNAMKKLKAEGYVQIEDKGRIVLTEKGKALALCDFPSADGYWGKRKNCIAGCLPDGAYPERGNL